MNPARAIRISLATVALAAVAAGCVRAPRPTGYLDNYAQLLPQPPPHLAVYATRTEAARQARADHIVLLLPSRWETTPLRNPSREAELLQLLDRRLFVYLLRSAPQSVIVTRNRDIDDFVRAGVNVTQVRAAITDLERGIGILRMLITFRLGATHLQVEGRLVDMKTQKELVRFARRGLHDGVVWGLPTPQSLSPRFCWRLSIDETARLLAGYIASQLTPPPPRWWERPDMGEPPLPKGVLPTEDTSPPAGGSRGD